MIATLTATVTVTVTVAVTVTVTVTVKACLESKSCLQDAWSVLGAPSSTFTKHNASAPQGSFASPSLQQHVDASSADYFYNYFDRYDWCWKKVSWCDLLQSIKDSGLFTPIVLVFHTCCFVADALIARHTVLSVYSLCLHTTDCYSLCAEVDDRCWAFG